MKEVLILFLTLGSMVFAIVYLKKFIRNIIVFGKKDILEDEIIKVKKSTFMFIGIFLAMLIIYLITIFQFVDFVDVSEIKVSTTYFVILIAITVSDVYFLKGVKFEKIPNLKKELKICKNVLLGTGTVVLLIIFGASSTHFNSLFSRKEVPETGAIRLTNDKYKHAPILFGKDIYFPSSYDFPDDRNTESLGEILPQNAGFLIKLINQDYVIADKTDENQTHIKTGGGDDITRYTKAEFLENQKLVNKHLEEYERYNLFNDEDNQTISIKKEIVVELEDNYGEIDYNADDFIKCDAVYYILAESKNTKTANRDKDDKDFEGSVEEPVIYIGCILKRVDNYYYGNQKNQIDEKLRTLIFDEK